jgi:hypothetical protein
MSTRRFVLALLAAMFAALDMGGAPAMAQMMTQPPAYYNPPQYQQQQQPPAHYQLPQYQQPVYQPQPYTQQSCCCGSSGGLFSGMFSGRTRSPCQATGYGAYPQYQPQPYYPAYQQQPYPAYPQQQYPYYPQYQSYPQPAYYPQTYPQPGFQVRLNVGSRMHHPQRPRHCFKSKGHWVCR